MNINKFEKQFYQTILNRGYDYYIDGHVDDIVQIDTYNWQAEVDGTSTYVVDIRMNEDGDIVYADCDCPFEGDCKHMVAVLYEIRDEQQSSTVKKLITKPTLEQLLQEQTKEQLVALFTKVCQNHSSIKAEVEMLLTKPSDSFKAAEKLIIHHIQEAQDRRGGFIPWNRTSIALKGIDTVQEKIGESIESGEYFTAIQLSLLCFHRAFETMEFSDDSSGSFGSSIDESLAFIEEAIWEGVDVWDEDKFEMVYELVMQEAMDKELDGWSDWSISLIRSCIPLCKDDTIEERYVELLHSLQKKGNEWDSKYINKEIKELQFQLLSSKHSKEEVERFLEQNIEDANMRERVILSAIKRKDYEKVLQLSLDGQQQDHGLHKWKRYAFTAYKALDNKDEMKKLALQLLVSGDYDYYLEYKRLHSTQQWPNALELLLETLKNAHSHLYTKLIVEESRTERILDYCKEQPTLIEQYYKYIEEVYSDEVCKLFIRTINASAARASDRKRYQDVCRTIKTMRKAGYETEVKQLITDLLQTYPKRRAFVDELQKIEK
ncbi:SWIM zinc finger domain-containing protein [Psychrobacillus sp. NPDC093180]|uniref:SWIM zinc finger family protein n=1 Tax=Psychrobacillus sp. NPDC093180 TaxID=3364489 RepID=UPI0038103EB5